jgi:hypothetical protein
MANIPVVSDDDAPAVKGTSVTASDSSQLSVSPCRAIYIGTGGNLQIKDAAGTILLFKNLGSGAILPVRATYIMATNTTAADIIALY